MPTADPHLEVVFVHGLGGDAGTWVNPKTNFNWPVELQKSDDRLRVQNITHNAPMFNFKDTDAVSAKFQDTARVFLDTLKNHGVGTRPIVFITHSLGGIIVKEALRIADHAPEHRPLLEKTRCIVFLSTPHAGAAIATVAGYLGPGVRSLGSVAATLFQIKLLSPLGIVIRSIVELVASRVRTSALTSQLRKNDSPLLSLNHWYRSLTGIESHAFYETERTYRCVHVVDPHSADPGIPGCIPSRAENMDHFSVCKPASTSDPLYRTVCRIVEDVRDRVRAGIDHPVFRDEIRETLQDTEFAAYRHVGQFADIPAAEDVRKRVETLLRQRFREQFAKPIASTERKLRGWTKSNYDIDRYILSLWLDRKAAEQLGTLADFIQQEEKTLRASANVPEPPTAILLYRAARTLERVLLKIDYTELSGALERAIDTVRRRYTLDQQNGLGPKGFDSGGDTQKLLTRLKRIADQLDEVKRNARPSSP